MLCGNGFRIKLHERKSMDIEFFLKYFARALTLLLVLPLHEAAHAGVARLMGDDTAQRQGRLTINPFSHLDPLGSLLIMLTGFGWAKPVPVNPMRMKKYRAGFALTALAGPVSNLLAAIAAAFVHAIIYSTEAGYKAIFEYFVYDNITPLFCVILLTEFLVAVNVGLALFNLIPLPPLDGFNVLRYFTNEKFDRWFYMHQREIQIGFLIFLVLFNSIDSQYNPLYYLSNAVEEFVWWLTSWIPVYRG